MLRLLGGYEVPRDLGRFKAGGGRGLGGLGKLGYLLRVPWGEARRPLGRNSNCPVVGPIHRPGCAGRQGSPFILVPLLVLFSCSFPHNQNFLHDSFLFLDFHPLILGLLYLPLVVNRASHSSTAPSESEVQ